jgi:hypothetical protein
MYVMYSRQWALLRPVGQGWAGKSLENVGKPGQTIDFPL